MLLNARDFVGAGFPPKEGERLADWVLENARDSLDQLEIDVSKCPPGLLISAFFNAFLQKICDTDPALLDKAKALKWSVRFSFQDKNLRKWIEAFHPHNEANSST